MTPTMNTNFTLAMALGIFVGNFAIAKITRKESNLNCTGFAALATLIFLTLITTFHLTLGKYLH